MSTLRILAGWTCIVAALLLGAFLLLGGGPVASPVGLGSPALMAHLPGVVFALALLAVGTWLLKRRQAP